MASSGSAHTLESRRALRTGIGDEAVRLAQEFIDNFSGFEQQFNSLHATVGDLCDACGRVRSRIEQTEERTASFLEKTQALQSKR